MRRNVVAYLLCTALLRKVWAAVSLQMLTWPAAPLPRREFFLKIAIKDSLVPATRYELGVLKNGIMVTSVAFSYAVNGSAIDASLSDPLMVFLPRDSVYPVDVKCDVSYTDGGTASSVSFSNTYSLSPSELSISLNLTDRTVSNSQHTFIGAVAFDPDDPSAVISCSWDCSFANGSLCTDSTGALLSLPPTHRILNGKLQSSISLAPTPGYYSGTVYAFKATVSSSTGKSKESPKLLISFDDLAVEIICPFLFSEDKACLMPRNQPLLLSTADISIVQWTEVGGGFSGTSDSMSGTYALRGGYWGDADQQQNTGKVCALVKDAFNRKGEVCMKLRGVRVPKLSFFTATKILEGARIDEAGKAQAKAIITEPGDQISEVASGLQPYSFSFGYCSLYYANKCVGTEYLLPYSALDVVRLSVPHLVTKQLFAVALLVKVRDSFGLEHVTYKKISPISPSIKLTADSASLLAAVGSSETYFYDLSVVLHSSQIHEGKEIRPFCDSLPAQLQTRLPALTYPTTNAALSCYIMCKAQFGTSVQSSLLKPYVDSELEAERRLAQMSGEFSGTPRFVSNFSNGLSGVYLNVIRESQSSFKSEVYSHLGMAGVEGSWGEWIEGTKSWTSVYTAGLEVYFRDKKYQEISNKDLKTQALALQTKIEGISYASLAVFDSNLAPITVANLSKLIHILMPTNETRIYVDGMVPVCEILTDKDQWERIGRFGIFRPAELDQMPIPSCSVDRTGLYRISLIQLESDGPLGTSTEKPIRFYSYYLFYVEVALITCCLVGLARAHLKDTLSPTSRYDYLRSLSASLAIRFMNNKAAKKLIPKTSNEQVYLSKLQQLQSTEYDRYLQVVEKLESIREKKRVLVAKEKLKKGEGTREDMDLIAKMVEREIREREMRENQSGNNNKKANYDSDEEDEAVFFDFRSKQPIRSSQIPAPQTITDGDSKSSGFITYLQESNTTISSIGSKNSKFGLLNKKVIQNKYAKNKGSRMAIDRRIFGLASEPIAEVPEEHLKEEEQQEADKIDPTQSMRTLAEVEVVKEAQENIDSSKDKSNRKMKVKKAPSSKNDDKSKLDNNLPSVKQEKETSQSHQVALKALQRRDIISTTDMYLSVHRVFGLFFFKDPFNLSIIRMLIVLNQYLFFFIAIGAVSIYTLTSTEVQEKQLLMSVVVWPLPGVLLGNIKLALAEAYILNKPSPIIYSYMALLLRLKHVDQTFIDGYLMGKSWKNIIKQMLLILEMVSYMICIFYISVSASSRLHNLVSLSFLCAVVYQILFIENLRVAWLLRRAIKSFDSLGGYLRIVYKAED